MMFPYLVLQSVLDWIEDVLAKGQTNCHALLLADQFRISDRSSDLEISVHVKRATPDTPLALPPAKSQDFDTSLPDSFSSNEDDVSAYRLQVLGPHRCEMLSMAAPNFVCQKGTVAGVAQAEQKKMVPGILDAESERFMETILNGLDDLIRVYSFGEEWRLRNYELARTYLSKMFDSLMQRNVTFRSCEELQSQIQRYELERACSIGEKTWGKLREIEGKETFALALLHHTKFALNLTRVKSGVHVRNRIL